jgi:hypothetical protein
VHAYVRKIERCKLAKFLLRRLPIKKEEEEEEEEEKSRVEKMEKRTENKVIV